MLLFSLAMYLAFNSALSEYSHTAFSCLVFSFIYLFCHMSFTSVFFHYGECCSLVKNTELGLAFTFYCFLFSPLWQWLFFNWCVYFTCEVMIDMVGCKPPFLTCFLFVSVLLCFFSLEAFFWDSRVLFSVPFSLLYWHFSICIIF